MLYSGSCCSGCSSCRFRSPTTRIRPSAEVTSYNTNLVSSVQPFAGNPGGVPVSQMSYDNPIGFVDAKLLAAVPSADGRISDRDNVSFLWGYGEEHGTEFEKPVGYCNDLCYATWTRNWQLGPEPMLKIKVTFNGTERDVSAAPGLVPLPFSAQELAAVAAGVDANNQSVDPVLTASISGTIYYEYDEYHPSFECITDMFGDIVGCGNEETPPPETVRISMPVQGNAMNFTVDSGNGSGMIVVPFGSEVTPPFGGVEAGMYLNRKAWRYLLRIDGKATDAYYFYKFDVSQDAYGAKHITAIAENYSGLKADDTDAAGSVSINSSSTVLMSRNCTANTSGCMMPVELRGSNDTFSRVYAVNGTFPGLVGTHVMQLDFSDMEGGVDSLAQNVSARYTAYITLGGGMEGNSSRADVNVRLLDVRGPVSNASVVVIAGNNSYKVTTDANGAASGVFDTGGAGSRRISACFAGDDVDTHACGELEFYPGGTIGVNWSVFGFGIAIIAIFAGIAYEASGHVFGIGFMRGVTEGIGFLPIAKLFRPHIKSAVLKPVNPEAVVGKAVGAAAAGIGAVVGAGVGAAAGGVGAAPGAAVGGGAGEAAGAAGAEGAGAAGEGAAGAAGAGEAAGAEGGAAAGEGAGAASSAANSPTSAPLKEAKSVVGDVEAKGKEAATGDKEAGKQGGKEGEGGKGLLDKRTCERLTIWTRLWISSPSTSRRS